MTLAILGLTAGFIFVVVLLLALNLHSSLHWTTKAGAILVALLFYLLTLESLPGFYGWPTQQALPKKFHLLSMEIREPVNEADKGAIFMWVIPMDGDNNQPRAYQLPYDGELHSRLNDARERMEFGHTLAGEIPAENSNDGNKHGALPRFYFVEKKRPPAKAQ